MKAKKIKSRVSILVLLAAVMIIALIFILIKYIAGEKMTLDDENQKKIIIIGIDGMDPRLTKKLMDEGRLPNFKKLSMSGTFSQLETSIPPQSPVAWAQLSTGSNPGKTNMFDFISRNPKTYVPELAITKAEQGITKTRYEQTIKADSFWKKTSEAGLTTSVIRWPGTFPAEKIKGNMLSGLGVPDIKGFLNSYYIYTSKFQMDDSNSERKIHVYSTNSTIYTEIKGPRTINRGKLAEISLPMEIEIKEDMAILSIQDKKYIVRKDEWSDFVEVSFKVNMLNEVDAVCRFYLINTQPFEMYMSSLEISPKNPAQKISYPQEYSRELAENTGMYHTLGMPEDTNALNDYAISGEIFLQQVEQVDAERTRMFWYEFQKNNSVLAFVFDGSDRVSHMFWDENVSGKNKGLNSMPVVESYYVHKDMLLGEIMQKIDNNTVVIVISDHGFTSYEKSVTLNTWLYENGYLYLTKNLSDIKSGELFEYVNWTKTKAYSLGFTSIYINEKGRENKGIVQREEKNQLINEISAKLSNLSDHGNKVFVNIHKASEIYNGSYISNSPDIVVGFAPGYRMSSENAVGGFTEKVIMENKKHWKGDHLVDSSIVPGVFFSNLKISNNNKILRQQDIYPTIMSILGIKLGEDTEGKSLI